MWYLTSENDNRIMYIPQNKEIIIGRSADTEICNFGIFDDPSISRKHAMLSISDNYLYVQDLGSRYGTFINDSTEALENTSRVKLCANDGIKFGKMHSQWQVHFASLVTCTSTLKGENLQNLKVTLAGLGGCVKNEWDDECRYLTMPAITLTIKVVLALVQGSHIVTMEFWRKCEEAIANSAELPDPKNFIPSIVESTLNKENVSFLPNKNRKNLFAGKKIIFFAKKQLEMYKSALVRSSANPLLLSESKMTKAMLCSDDVIVIQYNPTNISQETQAQRTQINDIVNYLKTNGKRVVADAEIGLAILYCSLEKYCNPDFNFSSEVIKQSDNTKSGQILAKESQDVSNKQSSKNVIIDESLTSDDSNDRAGSSKRKHIDDNINILPNNKKIAREVANTTESAKRKHNDDSNDTMNPSKKIAIEDPEADDFFNFKVPDEQVKKPERKLNLLKPSKRKADDVDEGDEFFNFVEDKSKQSKVEDTHNHSSFKSNSSSIQEDKTDVVNRVTQKIDIKTEHDIAAMRGVKLKELMESNLNITNNYKNIKVKSEETDELDLKMKDLDLGTTIIVIKDLIVKKEPLEIEQNNEKVKNFKKFKKVWPVKMQVTVIANSSLNTINSSVSNTINVN